MKLTAKDIPNSGKSDTGNAFRLVALLFILAVLPLSLLPAQPNCQPVPTSEVNSSPVESLFDRFGGMLREPMRITLSTDLAGLLVDRRNDEYQEASFELTDVSGHTSIWNARIKMRGRFRRMNCEFPPLKIDLDKGDLKAEGLEPFDQFKLVTHCMDDEASRQVVLREYMAYALYNTLTEQSFRARLVEVTYIDESGTYGEFTKTGFLIEDIDELANRLGGEELEMMNLPDDAFDPYQRMLHSLFQFMVANADYDLVMARNVKFIKEPYSGKVIAVPYDFDFSGLVDAPYAIPDPNIGLGAVTDRVFKGPREDELVVRQSIAHFQSKKEDFLRVIDELESLDRNSRNHARKMISTFFRILDNDDLVRRLFVASSPSAKIAPAAVN